ncbi:hypothetical protein [uncultured Enterococcus sp.]|uniref:hypothetical protein n=1 Tax=uncultured Enterococcus sp. TaxID=167972 RepID=UPI0025942E64|nr:hypothetical protein [uncultured Enterococcus sp.]
MFEELMILAKGVQKEFKEREENGWSEVELDRYKAGYDNAFFDIVTRLEGNGITSKQRKQLERAFDGEVEGGE